MERFCQESVIFDRSMKIINYFSPITLAFLLITIIASTIYNRRRARLVKLINKIPGPPTLLPFIGNSFEINVEHDEMFSRIMGMRKLFGRRQGFNKAWVGQTPYIFISKPSAVEPILSSSKHIDKSTDYDYLQPWLGTGLLTSCGKKWHTRRKILTPAFHFKILDDFLDVFHEQSGILVKNMANEIGKDKFNIFHFITLATLDIICETAMGRQINAQSNSESEYVKAVYEIGSIVLNRQAKIWLQPDIIFRCTKYYKKHQKCLKILHAFSNQVINERRDEIAENRIKQEQEALQNNNNVGGVSNLNIQTDLNGNIFEKELEDNNFGEKKRLAFLDLLLEASDGGKVLSQEDIREEVDTFMFEGHDTTSAAISWCLFLLGSHPEYQDRCVQEINDILGPDCDRLATMPELAEMKFLECCIKEALRLYPSVPLIARHLNEDVKIEDYIIPKGTTAMIVTYMLHRNPEVYPNPEKYDPERFLPANCYKRHAFAYIPFSAGPRNCIGQKFAIIEEKIVISTVLRKFIIEAVDRRENLTLLGELILRPKDGLSVKITART